MPGFKDVKDAYEAGKKVLKDEAVGHGRINLDPANFYFTGRDQILTNLNSALKSAGTTALSQAVSGSGGVGKTQIAKAYAYRYEREYKTIIWINSETPEQLQNEYAMVADFLELPQRTAKEIKVVVAAVKKWLESHSGWLLIFDNVEHPDHVAPYLPQIRKGHAIITSRHPIWDRYVASVLTVNIFEPEESAKFLFKRTGLDEKDAAAELAIELGQFPLALEQSGAYICENGISIADYLEKFKKNRLALLGMSEPVTEYDKIISTTWEISFKKVLDIEGALDLLNLCAYLAPDEIPLSLIKKTGEEDELNEILNKITKEEMAFEKAVTALCRYSICEKQDNGTLSFHRLVQEVVRNRLPKEEQETVALAALLMMAKGFPFENDDPATWEPTGLLIPHTLTAVDRISELGIKREEAAELMSLIGWYLYIRADFNQARELCENALMLSEEINGKEHKQVARRAVYLGYVCRALGELGTAKANYERALEIDERMYGPKHCEVAIDLNNLGSVLKDMGDQEGAKANYKRALKIGEKEYGKDHPQVAIYANNLGSILEGMGNLEGAEENYERALEIFQKTYGPEHPNVATLHNNLGMILKAMGYPEGAKANLERALEIFMKFLGDEHPNTLMVKENLNILLSEMK